MCTSSGPINVLGGSTLSQSNFTSEGVQVLKGDGSWTTLHATRNPAKYNVRLAKYIDWGASPRATIGMYIAITIHND